MITNEEFYEKNKDVPINKMQVIGSHDAAAYKLMCGGDNKWIKIANICRYTVPFVNKIIKDWTLTQDSDIYNQLEKGVRALDLRVTYQNGIFYFSHTFLCVRADEALREVKKYIDAKGMAFVFLFFKPDWEYRNTFVSSEFQRFLLQIFNREIFVNRNSSFPTLKQCLSDKRQIFCGFTEENSSELPEWIWGSDFFNGIWIQTLNEEEFYNSAKFFISNSSSAENKINHIPLVKTPTADVIKNDVKNRFKLIFYKSESLKTWSLFPLNIFSRLENDKVDTSCVSVFWLDYL